MMRGTWPVGMLLNCPLIILHCWDDRDFQALEYIYRVMPISIKSQKPLNIANRALNNIFAVSIPRF